MLLAVALCFAQQASPQQPVLQRFVTPIERIAERRSDGSWALPDESVRALESELAVVLGVPAPWHVELRGTSERWPSLARIERASPTATSTGRECMSVPIQLASGITLEVTAPLDASWIELDFSRFSTRPELCGAPLESFSPTLRRLAAELDALPLDGLKIQDMYLWLAPNCEAPTALECTLHLSGPDGASLMPDTICGLIPLACEDAKVASPELPAGAVKLADALRNYRAARDALPEHGWGFRASSEEPNGELYCTAELIYSKELVDRNTVALRSRVHSGLALGDVCVSPAAVRAILEQVRTHCVTSGDLVFAVVSCTDLRSVEFVLAPMDLWFVKPISVRALRFTLTPDGALETQSPLTTRRVTSGEEGKHFLWTISSDGADTVELRIRKPVDCPTGEDLVPRATVGPRTAELIGGSVFHLSF